MCSTDIVFIIFCFVFFFKQKTSYEMRISDWSSDLCSSDLGMIEFFYNIPGNRIIGRGGAYPTTPIGVLVIVFSGVVVRLCAGQSLPNCLIEPNGCIKSHFPVSIHVIYP